MERWSLRGKENRRAVPPQTVGGRKGSQEAGRKEAGGRNGWVAGRQRGKAGLQASRRGEADRLREEPSRQVGRKKRTEHLGRQATRQEAGRQRAEQETREDTGKQVS